MEDKLKEKAEEINHLRKHLHDGFVQTKSTDELLILSEKLDKLILEYLMLEKQVKSC